MSIRLMLFAAAVAFAITASAKDDPVSTTVSTTPAGELVLLHEVTVEAPIAKAWAAYTTEEGWTAWASPVAAIDLRAGGTICTHYTKGAKIGDPKTNTLHIVNYVPERVLTLQAELNANWPQVMQKDQKRMFNIVLFDPIRAKQTRIRSYGVGYSNAPEVRQLLGFFKGANAKLMRDMKRWVETP